MIKLNDIELLAFTKLRTRKIRTIITILLASLLFGVLIAASLVTTGISRSIDSFYKDGLTSEYIVSVTKAPGDPLTLKKFSQDPSLIAKAKNRYETLVEEKTAEAKRLNIAYSQASDQPPYTQTGDDSSTVRLNINDSNGIVYNLLVKKFGSQPAFDDAKLHSIANQYHATSFFASKNYTVERGSSLAVLPGGGEKFYDKSDDVAMNTNYQAPILSPQFSISPSKITTPFMLPNNGGWQSSDNTVPLILPQNTIEQLLGLEKLPDNADTTVKLNRLKKVRSDAASLTFQACYRNSASSALIQQTIQQQKDIKLHAGDKEYSKPTLLYSLPGSKSCKNPAVKDDTRSVSEKKIDDNQKIFNQEFNGVTSPTSYFIPFKVVGISPTEQTTPHSQNSSSRSVNDILNNLLATNGIEQTVPETLYNQIPDKSKYTNIFTYKPLYLFGNEDNKQRYVEFASASDAMKFIDEQGCTTQYDNTCKPAGRLYLASLAFNNSAALNDIRSKSETWFRYALAVVIVLAAIVMWITIGRTIADGRHETAVFRAIGFKRIDIVAVYILYTVILSTLVAVCATGIGFMGALIANQRFGPILTAQAQYGFGGLDLSKTISLMGIDIRQIGLLLLACLLTGVVSVIIPLLRNVRRSPIDDMREE